MTLGLEEQSRYLFQLDFSACFFQLLLSVFSSFFRNAFSYNLRSAIYFLFGFFQAQTGQFTNCLDHVYFLLAGFNQDNVELGLLFNSSSSYSWASRSGSSGNAEGFFHRFDQLNDFHYGFLADCFDDLFVSQRHDSIPELGDGLRDHRNKQKTREVDEP
ncbi:hypothetical protein EMIT0P260_210008 [Pseudomonas sp. IT-P260]